MKKLWSFVKGFEIQMVLAPLFKMLEASFDLFVPLVVANIINVGIMNQDTTYMIQQVLLLVLLAVLGLTASAIAQYFSANASVGITTRMRQSLFEHIQSFSFTQLDHLTTSTLVTRLTSDINQVQTGLNMGLRLLLRSPFVVFGSVIMAFLINRNAGFVFLVAVPVLTAVVLFLMLKSIPLFSKVQKLLDQVTQKVRENLLGVRVIRAFCIEKQEVQSFTDKNAELTDMNLYVGKLSALMNPATYLLINLATIVLIYVGAIQVNIGSIDQGDVVALYNYMAQMIVELVKLASLMITLNKAIACANRVEQIFEIEPDTNTNITNSSCTKEGSISFKHVSFTYEGSGEEALSDINFELGPKQTLGIIGGTGSGKSTLVQLITNFYQATSGEVSIDGVDIKEMSRQQILDKVGIVMQKAVLFKGTIEENLRWGNENATEEEIGEALEVSQSKEFVESKGLDAMIEQGGKNLSGGQRQRLTIARTLLKKPEILILDDSASALDYATDAKLRKAIRHLSDQPTTIIVSQRASSIMQADQILVLDDGKVAGIGTHEQLLNDCKVYQEIYESQYPDAKKVGA